MFTVLKFGNSDLVGYDYVSLGNTFLLFQKTILPTTARIERLKKKARYKEKTITDMQNVGRGGSRLTGNVNRPTGEV